jgi:hypothetical protein
MKSIYKILNERINLIPYFVLIYGIYQQVISYISRLNEPLLGMFEFRETQTAISAYWMMQGGPKIIYQTPVLGAPYTIPFEFPFFQWLTSLLSYLTPLSIQSSARTISFLFFGICLGLSYKIISSLNFGREVIILFIGLICLSPLYLYWSATSMIESMALAFALAWLLTYILFLRTDRVIYLSLAVVFGIMAALEKITTFPSILFIGAVLTIIYFYKNWTSELNGSFAFIRRNTIKALLLLSTVILPIIALQIWLNFADSAKANSNLGLAITSDSLRSFNFGTLEQRLDLENWKKVIFGRIFNHTLGSGWLIILFLGAAFVKQKKAILSILVCFTAFLLAPLLFFKLHMVHHYYQYANGIFLIFASAIVFHEGLKKQSIISSISLILTCFFMSVTFSSVFIKTNYMKPSQSGIAKSTIPTGQWIQNNTPLNSALYVFGIDWSSHMHFYANRKGVAAKRGMSYEQLDSILLDVNNYTGGQDLGAVVVCDRVYKDWEDKGKVKSRIVRLKVFLSTKTYVDKFNSCSLYN